MSEHNLLLKIITPERILFEGAVTKVSLPSKQGEITVLPKHIPLLSLLRAGEILIYAENKTVPLVISGGFAEITADKIIVLADTAERIEEIDEQRAQEAEQRAREMLKTVKLDSQEYAYLTAKVEKELTRLKIAHKHKKNIGPKIINE